MPRIINHEHILNYLPDTVKPASPKLLLSFNITFHTATLLWTVPAEVSENDSYTILYWNLNNPNVTLAHNVSEEGVMDHVILATITGLESGTLYQWTIETNNLVTTSRSLPSNFSTVSPGETYGCCFIKYSTILV